MFNLYPVHISKKKCYVLSGKLLESRTNLNNFNLYIMLTLNVVNLNIWNENDVKL